MWCGGVWWLSVCVCGWGFSSGPPWPPPPSSPLVHRMLRGELCAACCTVGLWVKVAGGWSWLRAGRGAWALRRSPQIRGSTVDGCQGIAKGVGSPVSLPLPPSSPDTCIITACAHGYGWCVGPEWRGERGEAAGLTPDLSKTDRLVLLAMLSQPAPPPCLAPRGVSWLAPVPEHSMHAYAYCSIFCAALSEWREAGGAVGSFHFWVPPSGGRCTKTSVCCLPLPPPRP